ncbi:hypothetical protein FKP32DRAFT_1549886, partial [Trametes sanguinea]
MRIDGTTCERTHLDLETGAVVLRRLHPRIASYNDVVIFLMKCNMDIKHIGSGEAAKALLYYVTDYITKPSLPTHVGLGALSYAIQKTNDQFPGLIAAPPVSDARTAGMRGALTFTVNRMMSRQEISHQQVMSYLVGGGDAYRSHNFRTLHWGSFDRLFAVHDRTISSPSTAEAAVESTAQSSNDTDDTFTLRLESGTISSANQRQDYVYRSTTAPFDMMCLYEFVGTVDKVSKHRDRRNVRTIETRHRATDEAESAMRDMTPISDFSWSRGRKAEPRGSFASEAHTQFRTHHLRRRTEWLIPVILGDRIPRSDRGDEEKEAWSRMMLILFIPWRSPHDLRNRTESWTTAFERHKSRLSPTQLKIIANMNVLSECRDVRDAHRDMRRAEALAFLKAGLPAESGHQHTGLDDENMHQDFELFDRSDTVDVYDNVEEMQSSQVALESSIGPRSTELVDLCYGRNGSLHCGEHVSIRATVADDRDSLTLHGATMRNLKKERRPRTMDPEQEDGARPSKRRRVVPRPATISRSALESVKPAVLPQAGSNVESSSESPRHLIDRIVSEMGLQHNPEQERAFRLVAEHVLRGEDQLLMYIAGVGGTGKTHVVKAIVHLFELLGR